ncbi:unnamed protein product [Didymodactylos carnosus]|uniref:Uncharacterized protein n=1 Tax=Didymodactylos carnosus TaxID=1234261 RepID=A0A815B8D3_9BILA|nr:unnamed protein product [Didymodactylos carnosus]CAF1267756.1 unnamed protein product [Didymodactylos carnosus]CAF3848191.1 unnamed protein product [Didymodactylos carnosus]CAF4052693.1 unnamed protein product [Didymodactylos carnosus]
MAQSSKRKKNLNGSADAPVRDQHLCSCNNPVNDNDNASACDGSEAKVHTNWLCPACVINPSAEKIPTRCLQMLSSRVDTIEHNINGIKQQLELTIENLKHGFHSAVAVRNASITRKNDKQALIVYR